MSHGGWAALPRGAAGCLQFVIVVFPDHTHLLFYIIVCLFQNYKNIGNKRTGAKGKRLSKVFFSKTW